MRRLLTSAAAAALAVGVMAGPALAGHGGSQYTATLRELNGSGVSGTTTITLNDDASQATIEVSTTGFSAALPHAQHIHGTLGVANACPNQAADSDGDGVITVAEGATAYGPVQVSLTTSGDTSADSALAVDRFPAGNATYSRTFPISEEVSSELADLHIVIHGVDENGNGVYDGDARSSLDESLPREATLPAACGTLSLVPAAASGTGGIATGAGGTATTSSGGTWLLLGGGFGIVALAAGLRRRTRTTA